jgi:hypothetical protein
MMGPFFNKKYFRVRCSPLQNKKKFDAFANIDRHQICTYFAMLRMIL